LPAVLDRLAAIALPPPHPHLGDASMTPFAIRSEPIAPHTIPAIVEVSVDRRLLPGESPQAAVAAVAAALRSIRGVEVFGGRFMLPADVEPDDTIIAALTDGLHAAGRAAEVTVSAHTFDAGYACDRGMPTPMFGPGRRQFGAALLAPEEVLVDDCSAAGVALATAVDRLCA
jgi:acetylornithine deacetylase